jgi:tRNA (guanine-N7-)-methyltransferase
LQEKFIRKIRSFVRREGRLTRGQQRALDELFPLYGLVPVENELINFTAIFGNEHPVHLEIGFGNGQTLTHMAAEQADVNFVGIEVHRPGVGNALLQIKKQSLQNVRVICEDAVEVITDHIPDNSLAAVYIFFPDPWHKKRHHKRRLVQIDFIEAVKKKMKPGGVLHLATDWEDYAHHMMEVMQQVEGLENMARSDPENKNGFCLRPDYRPVTRFEQRGLRLGHGVWDLMFKKIVEPES